MRQKKLLLSVVLVWASCGPVSALEVRFDTNLGSFDATLFPQDAPQTVQYFLDYISRGDYLNTLVHRSIEDFVIQGGGFYPDGTDVPISGEVPLELNRSHLRGTLAMAKMGTGGTNVSQWFINTADNPFLDTQNGGYTIIGEVSASGMTIVDSIAALPTVSALDLHASFYDLPVLDDTIPPPALWDPSNLVIVSSITVVPEPTWVMWAVATFVAIRRAYSGQSWV